MNTRVQRRRPRNMAARVVGDSAFRMEPDELLKHVLLRASRGEPISPETVQAARQAIEVLQDAGTLGLSVGPYVEELRQWGEQSDIDLGSRSEVSVIRKAVAILRAARQEVLDRGNLCREMGVYPSTYPDGGFTPRKDHYDQRLAKALRDAREFLADHGETTETADMVTVLNRLVRHAERLEGWLMDQPNNERPQHMRNR